MRKKAITISALSFMCGQRASAHGRAGKPSAHSCAKPLRTSPDAVVCVDCYHGVWESDVLSALTEQLNPSRVFCMAQATLPKEQVNAMLKDHLTDDRVFGIMAHYRIEQFFDMEQGGGASAGNRIGARCPAGVRRRRGAAV